MASHKLLQQTACSELLSPTLSPDPLPLNSYRHTSRRKYWRIEYSDLHNFDGFAGWFTHIPDCPEVYLRWERKGCDQLWPLGLCFAPFYPAPDAAELNRLLCHLGPGLCPETHTHTHKHHTTSFCTYHTTQFVLVYDLWFYHKPTNCLTKSKGRGSVPYREESAEELCDAGECCAVTFVLRQTAAQEPQPALPHFDGQGASCEEELGALVALHIWHSQWLHGSRLRAGVAQRVEHKYHAHPSEQQDDPAVVSQKETCWIKSRYLISYETLDFIALKNLPGNHCCNDSTHCGRIAALTVIRHPDSSQTGPHQLREVQECSQVHQCRDRAPGARVSNGTWESIPGMRVIRHWNANFKLPKNTINRLSH